MQVDYFKDVLAAAMLRTETAPEQADLVAGLIEEVDFSASLGDTLCQVDQRVERQQFLLGYVALTGALITQIERYWAGAFPAGA